MSVSLLPVSPFPPAAELTAAELVALVAATAADPGAWTAAVKIPEVGADRWWTRLSTSAAVDVWLLSWLPGHTTELHDHGSSVAAFTVVRGELSEVRAAPGRPRTRHVRLAGSVTAIPRGHLHDVTGGGSVPAVSIHAYSPPLTEMNYYDDRLRVVRTVRTHEPEEQLAR